MVGTFGSFPYRSHLADFNVNTVKPGVIRKVLRCDICGVPAEGVHYSVIKEFGVSALLETFL